MTAEKVSEILLDSLKESAIAFAVVFAFLILISLFEDKLAKILTKSKKVGPLLGSAFGLIPQCSTSVLGADLYIKKYITAGTLTAIFLSCNDEGLIVLVTDAARHPWYIIPLLILIKFIVGFVAGLIIDLAFRKQHVEEPKEEIKDVTCEEHHHENTKLHKHFLHPLLHSLEIFVFVFIASAMIGLIIGGVGEMAFNNWISQNKYLSPFLACVIGLIPNCAGSVLLATFFNSGTITFGALVGGLLVNSGLGILMLFRHKKTFKPGLIILGTCFVIGVIMAYIICLGMGF